MNGDVTPGDNVFSGRFTMSEAHNDTLRFRVSAAFQRILQRVQSDVFSISVESSLTVINNEKDFWALNTGENGIVFNFADVPSGTATLRIFRAISPVGPWSVAINVAYSDSLEQPLVDLIDGTSSDYYYKMEAINSFNALLKTYSTLFVHQYIEPPASSIEAKRYSLMAGSPIYDTEWITDEIYKDARSMTVYQIRDLLSDKGSFLATTTIDDTIPDTDGVKFSPAKTISQLANTYGINPQLILVSLQKESQTITATQRPKQPRDGWMGAKQCPSQTIRGQLECGVSRFRKYLTDLDNNGTTISGWQVGVAKLTSDNISVTPANQAIAALFTYTPWVGQAWGGQNGIGGTALNYAVWTPTLFGNIVHILKWKVCDTCFSIEVVNKGWRVDMGVADRSEGGSQPSSYHGVSAGLPQNTSYDITFECDLKTWDSYNPPAGSGTGYWDSFSISLTSNPYWQNNLSDPIKFASYLYGGGSYGDGILKKSGSIKKKVTISADPISVKYLNVMLDTATYPSADSSYPSWGTCTIRKVIPATKLGIFSAPE